MSFGFQTFDAGGLPVFTLDESLPRLVRSVRVTHDFSGTIHVPEFDLTRGIFYVSFCVMKGRAQYGGADTDLNRSFWRLADDVPPNTTDPNHNLPPYPTFPGWVQWRFGFNPFAVPTIEFDNSTKLASITPVAGTWPYNQFRVNPGGAAPADPVNSAPDYLLQFLHVREFALP